MSQITDENREALLHQMQGLVKYRRDLEYTHVKADELLVAALWSLHDDVSDERSAKVWAWLEAFIRTYDSIEKWYA